MTEITWTNYSEAKPIDDQLYIVRSAYTRPQVFAGVDLRCTNDQFDITEYTDKKWKELNK